MNDCAVQYDNPVSGERSIPKKGTYEECIEYLRMRMRSRAFKRVFHPDDWSIIGPNGRQLSWVL